MSSLTRLTLPPRELKKFGVNTVVRVCEATYDKAPVEKEGIQVLVSVVCAFPLNSHKILLVTDLFVFNCKYVIMPVST